MELEPEDVAKFSAALDKWMRTIESSKGAPHNSMGNATITVNAGGIGVWVSVTCCLVMLSLGIMGGFLYVNQSRKVDQMQDYLNAIYMQAPYLKPKENKP